MTSMSWWCSRASHPEIDMSSLSLSLSLPPTAHMPDLSLIAICTRTLQSGLQVLVLIFQIIHNSRKFRRVVANQLLRRVLLGDVSLLSDLILCQCSWHVDTTSTMFETTVNHEQGWSYLRSGVGAVMENMLASYWWLKSCVFCFRTNLQCCLLPSSFFQADREPVKMALWLMHLGSDFCLA